MPLPGPPAENDPPPPMSIFKTCKKYVKSVTKLIKIQAKKVVKIQRGTYTKRNKVLMLVGNTFKAYDQVG